MSLFVNILKHILKCALFDTSYNQAKSSQLSLVVPWILYYYCILVLTKIRCDFDAKITPLF